jgi:hypothetical protein
MMSSAAVKLDRSTVEFVTVPVGDAHGTSCRTKLGTNDAKLAREAIGFIDRVIRVFENHAALAFEVRADDEIKIEVWHWISLPSSNCMDSNLSLAGSPITTLLLNPDCDRLLHVGTATAPSCAHRRGHAPPVPFHAEVLELQGTEGTSRFRQRLFVVRLLGLIFTQAME